MAAGNGAQELEKLEAAITAARPRPEHGRDVRKSLDAGTIVAFAEAAGPSRVTAGRTLRPRARRSTSTSVCMAFARSKLQAEAEQYSATPAGVASGARWPSARRSWARPGNDHRRRLSVRGRAVRAGLPAHGRPLAMAGNDRRPIRAISRCCWWPRLHPTSRPAPIRTSASATSSSWRCAATACAAPRCANSASSWKRKMLDPA